MENCKKIKEPFNPHMFNRLLSKTYEQDMDSWVIHRNDYTKTCKSIKMYFQYLRLFTQRPPINQASFLSNSPRPGPFMPSTNDDCNMTLRNYCTITPPVPSMRRMRRRNISASDLSVSVDMLQQNETSNGIYVALPTPDVSSPMVNNEDDLSMQNLFSTFLQSPTSDWLLNDEPETSEESPEELVYPSTSSKPSVALPLLEMGFSMDQVKQAMSAVGEFLSLF